MSIRKGKAYPYGIHVKDMKELCANSTIEKMPAPKKVFISMSQHIGAPAIPIVNVGDKVTKRQLIGQASGVISANVYSSICGTVTAIEDIVIGNGQKMKYVVMLDIILILILFSKQNTLPQIAFLQILEDRLELLIL